MIIDNCAQKEGSNAQHKANDRPLDDRARADKQYTCIFYPHLFLPPIRALGRWLLSLRDCGTPPAAVSNSLQGNKQCLLWKWMSLSSETKLYSNLHK
jgi:hypothetical protein